MTEEQQIELDMDFQKLEETVNKAIEEEQLVTKELLKAEILTPGEKLIDYIIRFASSWYFFITLSAFIAVWMSFAKSFDDYPYILLNLILSCLAAFQAPLILMGQRRENTREKKRAENEHIINMKAEIEVRMLNEKMDLVLKLLRKKVNK